MKENSSALYSEYIIDGIRMDSTPAGMLMECMTSDSDEPSSGHTAAGTVIDETKDPVPGAAGHDGSETETYLRKVIDLRRKADAAGGQDFRLSCPDFHTRLRIASSLIDTLWRKGHFRLENVMLSAEWDWDQTRIGNMAAFYFSARAASEYIYDLGARLSSFGFREDCRQCRARFLPAGTGASEMQLQSAETDICDEDMACTAPDSTRAAQTIHMDTERKCPGKAVNDSRSLLIYIPFDTCGHRLGGSLFEEATGAQADACPEIRDPDYFIDCYEVVREFVEDGIVLAAATVSDGGLLPAAAEMCSGTGAVIDVSGIAASYMEKDTVRILFSEIPGVLIQIRESDADYVDSQLLLQDIAYYPVGHPGREDGHTVVKHSSRTDVAGILASLMSGLTSSEGED